MTVTKVLSSESLQRSSLLWDINNGRSSSASVSSFSSSSALSASSGAAAAPLKKRRGGGNGGGVGGSAQKRGRADSLVFAASYQLQQQLQLSQSSAALPPVPRRMVPVVDHVPTALNRCVASNYFFHNVAQRWELTDQHRQDFRRLGNVSSVILDICRTNGLFSDDLVHNAPPLLRFTQHPNEVYVYMMDEQTQQPCWQELPARRLFDHICLPAMLFVLLSRKLKRSELDPEPNMDKLDNALGNPDFQRALLEQLLRPIQQLVHLNQFTY